MKFSLVWLFLLMLVSALSLGATMSNTVFGFVVTCVGFALLIAAYCNRCCQLSHPIALVIGYAIAIVVGAIFAYWASTTDRYELPVWLENKMGELTVTARLGYGAIAGMNVGFIFVIIYNLFTNNLAGYAPRSHESESSSPS